jgi:hypothetical protein
MVCTILKWKKSGGQNEELEISQNLCSLVKRQWAKI